MRCGGKLLHVIIAAVNEPELGETSRNRCETGRSYQFNLVFHYSTVDLYTNLLGGTGWNDRSDKFSAKCTSAVNVTLIHSR